MRPMVNRLVQIGPGVLLGWAYPWLHRFGPWRRFFATVQAFDEVLYAEIAERRASRDLEARDDVLSRLLHVGHDGSGAGAGPVDPLTDAELRDQLVTLLLAGHETTASALRGRCTSSG